MLYRILSGMLFIFIISSCTRTSPASPPDNKDSVSALLDSAIIYELKPMENMRTVYEYSYDESKRLTEIFGTVYDTATIGGHTETDTFSIRLRYDGSESIPFYFTETQNRNGPAVLEHFPTYDDQGRIIVDSQMVRGVSEVDSFSYSDQWISVITSNPYLDTLFLLGNNIVEFAEHAASRDPNGQYTDLGQRVANYLTYPTSPLPSPFYVKGLANHVGACLATGQIEDMISPNLPDQITYTYANQVGLISVLNWTTNDKGQVISGTGTRSGTGETVKYYRFTYKK